MKWDAGTVGLGPLRTDPADVAHPHPLPSRAVRLYCRAIIPGGFAHHKMQICLNLLIVTTDLRNKARRCQAGIGFPHKTLS